MEGEELGMALNNVEQAEAAQMAQMAEQEFFDKYPRFNNDRSLGIAILDRLNQKGFDTSAADSAVQDVINEFRDECSRTMNLLAESNQQLQRQMEENNIAAEVAINELNKKMDAVDEAVMEASQETGNKNIADSIAQSAISPAAPEDLTAGNAEVPMQEPIAEQSAEQPTDMGAAPVDNTPADTGVGPAGEVPPPQETQPADTGVGPAGEVPPPQEQQLAPNNTLSDERLKNIKARMRERFANKAKNTSRLQSNIIEACGR